MSVSAHIAAQRADHAVPHVVSCRALGVAASTFYKWHNWPPTPARRRRAELDVEVRACFDASDGTYGSPRVRAALRRSGREVSKKTVESSMARQGLQGRARRSTQQPAPKDPRLEDPSRSPRRASTLRPTRQCCDDRLNPPNTRPCAGVNASPNWAPFPRSARSAIPTTTPSPKPSTASTRPNSSADPPKAHGATSTTSNSPRSPGCTGTTPSASTATSATPRQRSSRRPTLADNPTVHWLETNKPSLHQTQCDSTHRKPATPPPNTS